MNIYTYLDQNPAWALLQTVVLGYFLIHITLIVFGTMTNLTFRCWNRFLRHLNIRKQGWPPAHCDADGDSSPTNQQH